MGDNRPWNTCICVAEVLESLPQETPWSAQRPPKAWQHYPALPPPPTLGEWHIAPQESQTPQLVLTGGQGHRGVARGGRVMCVSRPALGESRFSYGPWATTVFCFSRNLPTQEEGGEGTHSQPHITPRTSDFSSCFSRSPSLGLSSHLSAFHWLAQEPGRVGGKGLACQG